MEFKSSNNSSRGGRPPVPPGTYIEKIIRTEETRSKSGNPMIAIVMEILCGPYAKRWLYDYLICTETMAWRAREIIRAHGLDPDADVRHEGLLGRRAEVTVEEKEYVDRDGNTRKTTQPAFRNGYRSLADKDIAEQPPEPAPEESRDEPPAPDESECPF